MKKNIDSNTINKVTIALSKLQDKYPEVYNLLDEEPFGHLIGSHMEMNNDTLRSYVADVELLLQHLNAAQTS